MFILPTAASFREWQIWHYQKRLSMATAKKEISFLSSTLKGLMQ